MGSFAVDWQKSAAPAHAETVKRGQNGDIVRLLLLVKQPVEVAFEMLDAACNNGLNRTVTRQSTAERRTRHFLKRSL